MPDLSPAPSSLGFISPVLGPWFQSASESDDDIADLALPNSDLSCSVSLPSGAIWLAPASGLLSIHIATANRPAPLASLRQAEGTVAFEDNATLLPEVASRLGQLSQAVPRPDSATAATAEEMTRPIINRLVIELAPNAIEDIGELSSVLPDNGSGDLRTNYNSQTGDDKAAFIGLAFSGADGFSNTKKPMSCLRRPEEDDHRLLQNNSASDPLNLKLWAFDTNGKPYDAGAVADIWGHLAGSDWDNLWASETPERQRIKSTIDGKIVHLVNAHEGPLETELEARINGDLTDLSAINSSSVLFTASSSPAIGISDADDEDTDTAPIARIAPLPAGPYSSFADASPFAGWSEDSALGRDFLRIAITDIEKLTIGLSREADSSQAEPRLRVSPARNTAETIFLPTVNSVAETVMERLSATDAAVQLIAPELDKHWGPQTISAHSGGDPFAAQWDQPTFSAHTIKGSGEVLSSAANDQHVVVSFDSSLPAGAWIRLWPHGRDKDTGRRIRMTGGAARVDSDNNALVMLPLPNGENGDGSSAVQFSFDMLLVTDLGSRLYTDMRTDRPAVDTSSTIDISALDENQNVFCPQLGETVDVAINAIPTGAPLFIIIDPRSDHNYLALDVSTLRPSDMANALITNINDNDTVVTYEPAFDKPVAGDFEPGDSGSNHINNNNFYKRSTGQEILDFAAYDTNSNQGVIGGVVARAPWHEAPPVSTAHAGVSASSEIHSAGVAVSGPAADALRLIMRERVANDIVDFISNMGVPYEEASAVSSSGPWTAILETASKHTQGHILMSLMGDSFQPSQTWDQIKQLIDTALSAIPNSVIPDDSDSVDEIIDDEGFSNDTAAEAFSRSLNKYREGSQGFARAAAAAIKRAEDFIWLQTPAFDNESFTDGDSEIHILKTLTDRLKANPALHCLIVIPEKYLPKRNTKLKTIRKSAINAAIKELEDTAGSRVAVVTPTAYSGRAFHMAATTLIVDDVVMFTGGTHMWRRGLGFDSSLAASVFDETLTNGKPETVYNARQVLATNLLGVNASLVPQTPSELVAAAQALNAKGGFTRVNPSAFKAAVDSTSAAEKAIWNPSNGDTIAPAISGFIDVD